METTTNTFSDVELVLEKGNMTKKKWATKRKKLMNVTKRKRSNKRTRTKSNRRKKKTI